MEQDTVQDKGDEEEGKNVQKREQKGKKKGSKTGGSKHPMNKQASKEDLK